jgi:hypothetical protein
VGPQKKKGRRRPLTWEKFVDVSQDDERLQKALVSLCVNGYLENSLLVDTFKKIASEIGEKQQESFEYFKSLLV